MTDFKNTKQAMYSTPMDVRVQLDVLDRETKDFDNEIKSRQSVSDQLIEQHIHNADAVILSYLRGIYGAAALNCEDPYFIGPVPVKDNQSRVTLNGIVVAATAITEQWLITFTAENAFSVVGSVSGAQGTGTIAADFTSTNADIQIKSADWSLNGDSSVLEGNQIAVATSIAHPTVRALSCKLAAAGVINSLYSGTESDESAWAKSLKKEVYDLLKMLSDPKSPVALNDINFVDIKHESVMYSIDEHGRDITEYEDITDDALPFDN